MGGHREGCGSCAGDAGRRRRAQRGGCVPLSVPARVNATPWQSLLPALLPALLPGDLPDDSRVTVDAPAGGAAGLTIAVEPDEAAAAARAAAAVVRQGGVDWACGRRCWRLHPCAERLPTLLFPSTPAAAQGNQEDPAAPPPRRGRGLRRDGGLRIRGRLAAHGCVAAASHTRRRRRRRTAAPTLQRRQHPTPRRRGCGQTRRRSLYSSSSDPPTSILGSAASSSAAGPQPLAAPLPCTVLPPLHSSSSQFWVAPHTAPTLHPASASVSPHREERPAAAGEGGREAARTKAATN
jgi:hypothetical protein